MNIKFHKSKSLVSLVKINIEETNCFYDNLHSGSVLFFLSVSAQALGEMVQLMISHALHILS